MCICHDQGIVGSIAAIMIGDVYSEKLFLCCAMNLVATGAGVFVIILWVTFLQNLSMVSISCSYES